MDDRKFGFFKTSNPYLNQHLHEQGIDSVEGMTEKVSGSNRLVWHYICCDELREHVNEFRNKSCKTLCS